MHWYKIRDNIDNYKDAKYWIVTILMILAGGLVTWVYGELGELNVLLALNVGASTPLIIEGLVKTPPEKPPGAEKLSTGTMRDFLSWR